MWGEWIDWHGAFFGGRPLKDQFADWLYSDNYDRQKLDEVSFYLNLPVVGDYANYLLDSRASSEYLSRYGMDYSDVHDPRRLKQTNATSRLYGSSLNFVSRNISKLYE